MGTSTYILLVLIIDVILTMVSIATKKTTNYYTKKLNKIEREEIANALDFYSDLTIRTDKFVENKEALADYLKFIDQIKEKVETPSK